MTYQEAKQHLDNLLRESPFYPEEPSSPLQQKVRHMFEVASLMEKAAQAASLPKKEQTMAYAAALFHDIACLMDISMAKTHKYGPQHGLRGAFITLGILTKEANTFSVEEREAIFTAIALHDSPTIPEGLTGITLTLVKLLRDCDKADCWRRQATEPIEVVFQKHKTNPESPPREDWAKQCLDGQPMLYSEMQNISEEGLLYLGWFFQLTSTAVRKAAYPLFEQLANRLRGLLRSTLAQSYLNRFVQKAQAQTTNKTNPSL